MSWEALAWAAKQRVTRAADKLVLIGLADRYNTEDGLAWPSLAWLAEFSSLDRKTIINALDRLQVAGLIADNGDRKGRTGQVKAYALSLNSTENTIPKTEPLNSAVFPSKQTRKRNTDTVREPSSHTAAAQPTENPSGKAKPAKPVLPAGVSPEQWDDFVAMRKRKRAPMTDRAQALMLAKLQRFADDGQPPGDILDQSTRNSWTDIYQLKGQQNGHDPSRNSGRMGGSDKPVYRRNPALELLRDLAGTGTAEADAGPSGSNRGTWPALPLPS